MQMIQQYLPKSEFQSYLNYFKDNSFNGTKPSL